jgi:hypothetical protein
MSPYKKKKPKSKSSISGKRKQSKIVCKTCSHMFTDVNDFRLHLNHNFKCKANHPFICYACNKIFINDSAFMSHVFQKQRCHHRYEEQKALSGQLPNMKHSKSVTTSLDEKGSKLISYQFDRYSFKGQKDNVTLNVIDTSSTKLESLYLNKTKQSSTLNDYLNTNRLLASRLNNPNINIHRYSQIHHDMDSSEFCVLNENNSTVLPGTSTISHNNDNDNIDVNNQNELPMMINADMNIVNNNRTRNNLHDNENANGHVNQCIDVINQQNDINKRFNQLTLNPTDKMLIDLFHMHRASNAPMILFDRTIEWIKRHEHTINKNGSMLLKNRNKFLSEMNRKVYSNIKFMQPTVDAITLTSNRQTTVVTFSLKDAILRMVTNKVLFKPEHLLLNVDNPCMPPTDNEYISDVNSGSWFQEAWRNECHAPNHILMPFAHFIDGLNCDKFGKLTVEAVLTTCLWFKQKVRNRSEAWWPHGFVQDQKLFGDQQNYSRNDVAQDYHDMMSHIFKEMKQIRDNGGIKLILDFGKDKKHEVIAIPVIQFIIGDCKGNDLLCGRMGAHGTGMGGLCRDCNVSPMDGDNPCVGHPLRCSFHKMEDIIALTPEQKKSLSFLPIKNCFYDLSFGGCARNIFGATPAEILHAIQLGLCNYIAESMEVFFTNSCMDAINNTIAGIVLTSKRQSERSCPDVSPFRLGLMSIKTLKAKERFARIYCLYLVLSNSYLVNFLCTKKRKKYDNGSGDTEVPFITKEFLKSYYMVVQDTLIFHQWMKQDKYKKSDFIRQPNEVDSKVMNRIKHYLQLFKQNVLRKGNGLKTPKFHQMLHVPDYILRHGSPNNYDGSRGENFGKVIIKDNAKLTNKQKDTLNFDIARRISEEDVIDRASSIYYYNYQKWPSQYCNDVNLPTSDDVDDNNQNDVPNVNNRPRFFIECKVSTQEETGRNEIVEVRIDWGGVSKTPLQSYPDELLKAISSRFFIGSPNVGGRVDSETSIPCYTQLAHNNIIFRSNPCYAKKGPWFDWGMFEWEGYTEPIHGQIMMIVDLTNAHIIYDMDIDPDEALNNDEGATNVFRHLTQEIWVVLRVSENELNPNIIESDSHFDSVISKRIMLLNDDDFWMVPLKCLVGPCNVIHNKDYTGHGRTQSNDFIGDNTAYVVKPMKTWHNHFLL